MRFNKLSLLVFCMLFASSAFADRQIYAVLGAGYAQNEVQSDEFDSFSYRLGIGVEITKQWVVEVGFQSFADENAGDLPTTTDEPSAELPGFFLSALGKAEGRYGELFYRLGAVYIEPTYRAVSIGSTCPTEQTFVSFESTEFCEFDDPIVAGQLGIGYDLYISPKTLLRSEVEWVKGQDDYESLGLYLGFRVNF